MVHEIRRVDKFRLFLPFLLSYLLILLIPLLMSSALNELSLRLAEDFAGRANLSKLERISETFDHRMLELEGIVRQLATNSKVQKLLYEAGPVSGPLPYKMLSAWSDLRFTAEGNELVTTFYVYLDRLKVILSSSRVHIDLPFDYDRFLRFGDMDYRAWQERVLGVYHYKEILPAIQVTMDAGKTAVVPYLQSIPLDIPGTHSGLIILLLNAAQISGLLDSLSFDHGGGAYIALPTGRILATSSTFGDLDPDSLGLSGNEGLALQSGVVKRRIRDTEMMVFFTTSPVSNWRFVAAIPSGVVMTEVAAVSRICWIATVSVLILGLLLAGVLSYSHGKPVWNLFTLLGQRVAGTRRRLVLATPLQYLQTSIRRVIESNRKLSRSLEIQSEILKSAVVGILLRGDFGTQESMETYLQHAGVWFMGKSFVVLLCRIEGYEGAVSPVILDELNRKKVIIRDAIRRNIQDVVFYDPRQDRISALVCDSQSPSTFRPRLERSLSIARSELSRLPGIKTNFVVGNLYGDVFSAHHSYNEAWEISEQREWHDEEDTAWVSDTQKEQRICFYPLNLELRLINVVRAGLLKQSSELLDYILTTNLKERSLSGSMKAQLHRELLGTYFRIVDQFGDNGELRPPEASGMHTTTDSTMQPDGGEGLEALRMLFMRLCAQIHDARKNLDEKRKSEIIEYMAECYSDKMLCLSKVSDRFNLSEAYFSRFFKEQFGEPFSSYLERLRMAEARRLLTSTSLSVDAISGKTGYCNTRTFRRAFKRANGISPNSYRAAVYPLGARADMEEAVAERQPPLGS